MRFRNVFMILTLGAAAACGEASAQETRPLNPTNFGLVSPQPQSELPQSVTPPQQAVRKPKQPAETRLEPSGPASWELTGGWELAEADRLTVPKARYSAPLTTRQRGTTPSYPVRC